MVNESSACFLRAKCTSLKYPSFLPMKEDSISSKKHPVDIETSLQEAFQEVSNPLVNKFESSLEKLNSIVSSMSQEELKAHVPVSSYLRLQYLNALLYEKKNNLNEAFKLYEEILRKSSLETETVKAIWNGTCRKQMAKIH